MTATEALLYYYYIIIVYPQTDKVNEPDVIHNAPTCSLFDKKNATEHIPFGPMVPDMLGRHDLLIIQQCQLTYI